MAKFLIHGWKRRWGEAMARRDFRQLGLAGSIVRRRGLARNDAQLQVLCAAINLRRALALGLA
jgi:IS5 family transposase